MCQLGLNLYVLWCLSHFSEKTRWESLASCTLQPVPQGNLYLSNYCPDSTPIAVFKINGDIIFYGKFALKSIGLCLDIFHTQVRLFSLLPHSKWYQCTKSGTNSTLNSSNQPAIRLLNSSSNGSLHWPYFAQTLLHWLYTHILDSTHTLTHTGLYPHTDTYWTLPTHWHILDATHTYLHTYSSE